MGEREGEPREPPGEDGHPPCTVHLRLRPPCIPCDCQKWSEMSVLAHGISQLETVSPAGDDSRDGGQPGGVCLLVSVYVSMRFHSIAINGISETPVRSCLFLPKFRNAREMHVIRENPPEPTGGPIFPCPVDPLYNYRAFSLPHRERERETATLSLSPYIPSSLTSPVLHSGNSSTSQSMPPRSRLIRDNFLC